MRRLLGFWNRDRNFLLRGNGDGDLCLSGEEEDDAPVYDYETGRMQWNVEVNTSGLSMEEVVLEDKLPAGLTYVDGSLTTDPVVNCFTVRLPVQAGGRIALPHGR